VVACAAAVLSAGCGESPAPKVPQSAAAPRRRAAPTGKRHPKQRPPQSQTATIAEPVPAPPSLPEHCTGDNEPCLPPKDFVKRLCRAKYPSVALVMFQKRAPWSHAFVKVRDVRAVNSYGGPVSSSRLVFSEEVVLLRHRPYVPRGGVQDDGPDNYDVLRLDGTCARLAEDEFRSFWYGTHKYAPIRWERIDSRMREVLATNTRVDRARTSQYQDCRGSYLGGGGAACQKATQKLATEILDAVNRGIDLPSPRRIPKWSPD